LVGSVREEEENAFQRAQSEKRSQDIKELVDEFA